MTTGAVKEQHATQQSCTPTLSRTLRGSGSALVPQLIGRQGAPIAQKSSAAVDRLIRKCASTDLGDCCLPKRFFALIPRRDYSFVFTLPALRGR